MNKGLIRFGSAIFVVFLLFYGLGARAEPVAMVTDLLGKARVEGHSGGGELTILSQIEPEVRVRLDDGARLVVLYLKSSAEYELNGPGLVEFKQNQPRSITGSAPRKRESILGTAGKNVRINPMGMAQGALIMRGAKPTAKLKLLTPVGTKTLEARPAFRWQPLQPGLKYRFELTDDTGRLVLGADVEGESLPLPQGVELKEGVHYTWEVSTNLPDGMKYSSAGDFSIATAALRADIERLRPLASAPISEKVTFAAWLNQIELRDEARKYWKALAEERRDDPRLKALAGE